MRIQVIASGSSGNCYLVEENGRKLLLDAGIPIKKIRRHVNPSDLTGVLLTHRHKDHCKAAKDLCELGIPIYAPFDTLKAEGIDKHPYAIPVVPGVMENGTITSQYGVPPFIVIPFSVEHDVPSVGFFIHGFIGNLLYFTDTMYIRYRFPKIRYLLAECNYCEDILKENVRSGATDPALGKRIRETHMSLETLKEFLKTNDTSYLEEIYLLHLSDHNSDAERMRKEIRQLAGCEVYIA